MSVRGHVTLNEIKQLADDAAVRINNAMQFGGSDADTQKVSHIIQMAIAKGIGRERQAGVQS